MPAMVKPSQADDASESTVGSGLAAAGPTGSQSSATWDTGAAHSTPGLAEPPRELVVPDRLIPDQTARSNGMAVPRTPPARAALHGVPEPLFSSSAGGPDESHHPPWAMRPRRSRGPRRRAAQVAAADSPAQLSLFDIPPPPIRDLGRRTAPGKTRPSVPRK